MKDYAILFVRVGLMLMATIAFQTGLAQLVSATPYQLRDVVEFGANEFHVAQLPIQKIVERSKTPLTITNTANNKGYEAKWAIQGNQLFLIQFKAKNKEKEVGIGNILENAELPVKATWFTGKLQLPIGDFDYDNQRWPLIIELTFDKGKLRHMSTKKDATEIYTWNGLSDKRTAAPRQDAKSHVKTKQNKSRELQSQGNP